MLYFHKEKMMDVKRVNPVTPVSKVTNKKPKEESTGVATQKVRSVGRLAKPFEGADSLMEWHKEKTKSSMSEAYRDADYATAGWRFNSEWDDFVQFVKDTLIVIPFIALAFYIVYEVFVYLDILVVRL
jgi:hypothetical protein